MPSEDGKLKKKKRLAKKKKKEKMVVQDRKGEVMVQ
jgi:hypothetical protein